MITETADLEVLPVPTAPDRVSHIPTRAELNVLVELANSIVASGMPLPKNCATPQAVLAKMLYGRELGLPPMASLHEIDIIEGKAGLNARTQVALVRRRALGDIRLVESSKEKAVVKAWRNDAPDDVFLFEFTMDDAARAELANKLNWRRFPQSMLVARATALASHALFQEVFVGSPYTPDELGAETDEDGRVVEFIDTVATSGVKRKATPTITTEEAEQVVDAVAAQQAPAQAAGYAPPEVDEDAKSRIKGEVGALVKHVLKLPGDDWSYLKRRFGKTQPLDLAGLRRLRAFLGTIAQIRGFRREIDIPDDKWSAALERRGVARDLHLGELQAEELHEKLGKQLTPFKLDEIKRAIASAIGVVPQQGPADSTAGNG